MTVAPSVKPHGGIVSGCDVVGHTVVFRGFFTPALG
jgi:hypothetical protein